MIYLCETLHFVLYAWSSYFALFLNCLNIAKLLKFKRAARLPFQNWHSCVYLLETFSWNALTSISLLVALVIKGLIILESRCHQNPPMLSHGYVKYEEAKDQLSCRFLRWWEKKIKFRISLVQNSSLVILVWDITFFFIFMVQLFCVFFELCKITKLLNSKRLLNGHFEIVCSQKLIRSLDWLT